MRNFIRAKKIFLKENETGMYNTKNIYKYVLWERFIKIRKNKTTTCGNVYMDQFDDTF